MAGSPASGDSFRSVFGKSRRRFILYYLLSNEYTDIDTLSVQVAAWEEGESVTSVDEATLRRVKISLHHNHLPRIEAQDIIEFDARSGDVVRSDRFDEVRSTVERIRETDEQMGRTQGSQEATSEERDGEQVASNT